MEGLALGVPIQPDTTQIKLNRLHFLAGKFFTLRNPWNIPFSPAKVLLMCFEILYKVFSVYCALQVSLQFINSKTIITLMQTVFLQPWSQMMSELSCSFFFLESSLRQLLLKRFHEFYDLFWAGSGAVVYRRLPSKSH